MFEWHKNEIFSTYFVAAKILSQLCRRCHRFPMFFFFGNEQIVKATQSAVIRPSESSEANRKQNVPLESDLRKKSVGVCVCV